MLSPLPASKWNYTTAAHLLNRAGFGGPPEEIEKLLNLGPEEAVASLVDYESVRFSFPEPPWARPDPESRKQIARLQKPVETARRELAAVENNPQTEPESLETVRARLTKAQGDLRAFNQDYQKIQRQRVVELRRWWLERMVKGPRPLEEKLTLFWHGHFATSVQKVNIAYFLWLQNETFRRHASGNWLELLAAVTRDPAMLIWLDQTQSRKANPNENYARELMELFSLGEGNYTEKDVREAARALTGLTVNRLEEIFEYKPGIHDAGSKSFLRRSGSLAWMDVLEQIVSVPQSARFICAKIWGFFARENPPSSLVDALAGLFQKAKLEFNPLLHALFRAEEFYAGSVIRTQIKSPVQWLVNSVRLLERELPGPARAGEMLRSLGQDLFAPPNVKGWDGGTAWITTNNLLNRYNHAATLVQGNNPKTRPVDLDMLLTADERVNKEALSAALEKRFFQIRLPEKKTKALRDYLDSQGKLDDQDILTAIRLMMSTPEYQLT